MGYVQWWNNKGESIVERYGQHLSGETKYKNTLTDNVTILLCGYLNID